MTMQFTEWKTMLEERLETWDKEGYTTLLFSSDFSGFTSEENSIAEKWRKRELAMKEIKKEGLLKILHDPSKWIAFDRAEEGDPDLYYPPQRSTAYTCGHEDDLIAYENIQELRVLEYEDFIQNYFGNKENLMNYIK